MFLSIYLSMFIEIIAVTVLYRGADAEEVPLHNAYEEPQFMEEKLTREEWQAINKLLSYQPDEEIAPSSSKDMQNMMKLLVTITIGHAAARIISVNQMEIVCGRFEQLHVSTKFKHRSIYCDVLLKFYGLSAPEGSLAQVYLYLMPREKT